jgi:hypothetical protein
MKYAVLESIGRQAFRSVPRLWTLGQGGLFYITVNRVLLKKLKKLASTFN